MNAFDEYTKRNIKPAKVRKKEFVDEPDELIHNPAKEALWLILFCVIVGAIAATPKLIATSLRFGWDELPLVIIIGTLLFVSVIGVSYAFLGAKFGKRKSEKIIKRFLVFTIVGTITYFVATNITKENTPMFWGFGGFSLIMLSMFGFSWINSDGDEFGFRIPILGILQAFEVSMYGMIKGITNPISNNGFFVLTSIIGIILIIVSFCLI